MTTDPANPTHDDADDWAATNAALARFGLPARSNQRANILAALTEQVRREGDWLGDHFLMRLLCVQLFSLGHVDDSLAIWAAKSCNFDTHCGIDVQLLCGAGLAATQAYLRTIATPDALAALDYLTQCDQTGDFINFTPADTLAHAIRFYAGPG